MLEIAYILFSIDLANILAFHYKPYKLDTYIFFGALFLINSVSGYILVKQGTCKIITNDFVVLYCMILVFFLLFILLLFGSNI